MSVQYGEVISLIDGRAGGDEAVGQRRKAVSKRPGKKLEERFKIALRYLF